MFPEPWFESGAVTAEAAAAFEGYARRDPGRTRRHWLWLAFQDHLEEHGPLPADRCRTLYSLGEREPDRNLGMAMMCAILYQRQCPTDVKRRAEAGAFELRRAIRLGPRGSPEGTREA